MKSLLVAAALALVSTPTLGENRDRDITATISFHPMVRFGMAEREILRALDAVQKASKANSGILTTTGTIEQNAAGELSYSAEPKDHLVASLSPEYRTYNISAFEGDLAATGQSFLAKVHKIHFHARYSFSRIGVSSAVDADGKLSGSVSNAWEFDRGDFTFSGRTEFTKTGKKDHARTQVTISGSVRGLDWDAYADGSLDRTVVTSPGGTRFSRVETRSNGTATPRSQDTPPPFMEFEVKDMRLISFFKDEAATSVDDWKFTGTVKRDGGSLGEPTITRNGNQLQLRLNAPLTDQVLLRTWDIAETP